MQTDIKVTEAALQHIENKIAQEAGVAFRLSIKTTGCSGYAYVPTIIQALVAEDIALENKHNIPIFIDPKALPLLQGLTVDFVEEDKMGLKQKRLIFTNPQEANRCGCGESFNLKS